METMSQMIPRFTDIFDEETFYIFVVLLMIVSILVAVILSRYYQVKDRDHVD